ncbi:porin [Aquincola sp. S2]|uniref:Porin n=1 Tax=Pseudaquabacterium terrae TaxID=2732868 RepID=A0ABX2EDP6_9BURK|nr:porin [Aquabacterium terrae]NRF66595.1 porin [Aquabacterium terrae]
MKKSLLALAMLASFAGVASAQSSVTLFGIVDAGVARLTAKTTTGSKSVTGMVNSGLNSSRLGFRGVEDLGGGLRAAFHIEGQLFNDSGDGRGTGLPFDFQRRSTVSLLGGFGEVRLGRDYTPTFLNVSAYDVFGTNSVGTSLATSMLVGLGVANQGNTRQNNSVGYFLPGNLGGFTGQFMFGFAENTSGTRKANQFIGTRLGYAAGPLSVHGAYGESQAAVAANDIKYASIGASYDLGAVKLMGYFAREKADSGFRVEAAQIGASVPLGQGELRTSFARYDIKTTALRDADWNKFAIGYGYNLSKRTQLYSTYARVSNKGGQVKTVTDNGLGFTGVTILGGKTATGLEAGIRHIF